MQTVENALASDVCDQMGSDFNPERFVPYVMMHEFEAMLFSDCERFAEGIGEPELAPKFQEIRDKFASPEEIDDSPHTAPSKRIESLLPGYKKPVLGIWAAEGIGLKKNPVGMSAFSQLVGAVGRHTTAYGCVGGAVEFCRTVIRSHSELSII